MGLTNQERRQKAELLKDSRALPDKIAAAQRRPIQIAPPNPIDAEIARLEKSRYEAKLAKMDAESRRLTVLKEIRDREPVEAGRPHPRIARIEALIDSIVENPERELGDYELAVLVLAQHQPGMSLEVADQLWRELQEQESNYLTGKRAAAIEKQSALLAELAELDMGLAEIADKPAPEHYAILANALNSSLGLQLGVALNVADRSEVLAAQGDPEAEQAVAMKHAAKIQTYLEAVNAGQTEA